MAKFYGAVGYSTMTEKSPGVWADGIVEKNYYGDVRKDFVRTKSGEGLNDNIDVDNKCEIVADSYAYENFHNIRYIVWMGQKWKIKSIDVQRPRLILWIGGFYNESSS